MRLDRRNPAERERRQLKRALRLASMAPDEISEMVRGRTTTPADTRQYLIDLTQLVAAVMRDMERRR
jgi:hypothetical protein